MYSADVLAVPLCRGRADRIEDHVVAGLWSMTSEVMTRGTWWVRICSHGHSGARTTTKGDVINGGVGGL
jgi:hypothetical protein